MDKQTVIGGLGIGLLVGLLLVILLIASGRLDPQPVGSWQWEQNLAATRPPLSIPPDTELVVPLPTDPLPTQFSLQLTAVWQSGAIDSGYGLALFDNENSVIIANAPTGYIAIFNGQMDRKNDQPFTIHPLQFILPWQTWPHVKSGNNPNEIRVDLRPEVTRVWVNREILWEGIIGFQPDQIGLYGASFGTTAVVDFQTLTFYAPATETPLP